jgi:hypothetical protein
LFDLTTSALQIQKSRNHEIPKPNNPKCHPSSYLYHLFVQTLNFTPTSSCCTASSPSSARASCWAWAATSRPTTGPTWRTTGRATPAPSWGRPGGGRPDLLPPCRQQGLNTGVVLYDLARLRASTAWAAYLHHEEVFRLMAKYGFHVTLGDQDWLSNVSFEVGHPRYWF